MRKYKPNLSKTLFLNTEYNCDKSNSINVSFQSNSTRGSGYTSKPTLSITSTEGDYGYGASFDLDVITPFYGDWIIIKLPVPIILTRFIFNARPSNI
jgi:hypothetical protein